jgi:hypothetical protein
MKRDAKALELSAHGWSYRRIAGELGCSISTVCRGIRNAIKDIEQPAVEEYRAVMDEQLGAMQDELMEMYENSVDDDTALKALDRVMKVMERRAKLHGMDAPVKAEVDVKNVTVQLNGVDTDAL